MSSSLELYPVFLGIFAIFNFAKPLTGSRASFNHFWELVISPASQALDSNGVRLSHDPDQPPRLESAPALVSPAEEDGEIGSGRSGGCTLTAGGSTGWLSNLPWLDRSDSALPHVGVL